MGRLAKRTPTDESRDSSCEARAYHGQRPDPTPRRQGLKLVCQHFFKLPAAEAAIGGCSALSAEDAGSAVWATRNKALTATAGSAGVSPAPRPVGTIPKEQARRLRSQHYAHLLA